MRCSIPNRQGHNYIGHNYTDHDYITGDARRHAKQSLVAQDEPKVKPPAAAGKWKGKFRTLASSALRKDRAEKERLHNMRMRLHSAVGHWEPEPFEPIHVEVDADVLRAHGFKVRRLACTRACAWVYARVGRRRWCR